MASMSGADSEVMHDLTPLIRVYRNGRIERLSGTKVIPPFFDPETGVECKDIAAISPETGLGGRIYMRKYSTNQKLPLLIYFHGGAFCLQSPYSPVYKDFLRHLVAEANGILVSMDYRKSPEHPLPAGYEDSWEAIKWVASHSGGSGPEPWLNQYADFRRAYLVGDSAGGNIAHHMAMRVGQNGFYDQDPDLQRIHFAGLIMIQPCFWGKHQLNGETTDMNMRTLLDKICIFANYGDLNREFEEDPLMNPVLDPGLTRLGCRRVLVCTSEYDVYKARAYEYCEALVSGGWGRGRVEIFEVDGEGHAFAFDKEFSDKAMDIIKRIVSFMSIHN